MPIDYRFRVTGISDYEMTFLIPIRSKIFKKVYIKSLERLKKKLDKEIEGDIDLIKEFDIDEKFFNLVKTSIRSQIKQVKREVKKDKIIVLNEKVTKAKYIRNQDNDDWICKIVIGGQYADKR